MFKLRENLAVKITAIFLVIIFGIGLSVTLVTIIFAMEQGFFLKDGTNSFYDTQFCKDLVYEDYSEVTSYFDQLLDLKLEENGYNSAGTDGLYSEYEDDSGNIYINGMLESSYVKAAKQLFEESEAGSFDQLENIEDSYLNYYKKELSNKNFQYQVKTTSGKLLFGNYDGGATGYTASYNYTFAGDSYGNTAAVVVNCYVSDPLTFEDDYSYYAGFCDFLNTRQTEILVLSVVCFGVCLICYLFLCAAVGHRRGVEGVVLNFQDKIPFDLLVLMSGAAFIVLSLLGVKILAYGQAVADYVAGAAALYGAGLLFLDVSLTFATRVKFGGWWRNTLTYRFIRIVYHSGRKIPIIWKGVLVTAGIIFAEFIFGLLFAAGADGIAAVMWLIFHGLLFFAAINVLFNLRKLKESGERIAAGDIDYQTETASMFGDFKRHAENLNSIADGMTAAVEERMKSERFKTELITNVSHDIKTPLTSIINYVDLLKKENITDPKAVEYLEVLERQSARLKKLIEDLVEASKASTGNLRVDLVKMHLSEMLGQSIAEYAERFERAQLEVIVNCGETLYAWADGKLLWRVLDNLMGNVCKYAQPGTRVYLDAEPAQGGRVAIHIKNISSQKLNINPEELMERFVRGDSSRSTEGSGLGLSIARSLTELQKGLFKIDIDGDLFKVTVELFSTENS